MQVPTAPLYLFLCCFLTGLWACDAQNANNKKKEKAKYEGALVAFDSVTTLYTENSVLKIKLHANKQYVEQSGDIRYPKGVDITMYNPQGIRTTTLHADSGVYFKNTRLYQGYGNIVVVNLEQRQTLETTQLNWDQNKREISTEADIKITTPNERLTGKGLVADDAFTRYRIKKPEGVFSLDN